MNTDKYDINSSNQFYRQLLKDHGYTPMALGLKGEQLLRFHQLTSDWDLNCSSILDVGCGFGDFNKYLQFLNVKDCSYTGIEVVKEFFDEACKRYSGDSIRFCNEDFLGKTDLGQFDYAFASGTFNLRIEGIDEYEYVFTNMKKMFSHSKKAIAIDFLSDKVDYSHSWNFNFSPEKILSLAYQLSRNVSLKNTYFPFEFSIIIHKDDSFRKETTIFTTVEEKFKWLK